jgi:glycosyltransferase involved in cell wall biosynthesis
VHLLERQSEVLTSRVKAFATMTWSRRSIREIRREILAFSPDVIHVHNAYPALGPAVHLVAEEAGIPLVMTVHNYRLRCPNAYMFTQGEMCTRCINGNHLNAIRYSCLQTRGQSVAYAASLWLHRFVLQLEKKVSLFLCPSEFVSRQLAGWGVEHERLAVVRHFTDVSPHGNPTPGSFGAYVGRLSQEKGIDVLLEALSRAGDPPFRIIGDGPEMASLQHKCSALGLRNTEFLGRLSPDGVGQCLRQARFLVAPTLSHETASLSALEAMARGRPLIVSDVGGLPELARDGRGFICRPGDVSALAKGISSMMADDELCISAGRACSDFVREESSPHRHRALLERAYRRVVPSGTERTRESGG